MGNIKARSCVFAKIGELVQGRLTPTEDIIIPGITSSYFHTKTHIYVNDHGQQNLKIRNFVYPAIWIFYQLKNGLSLEQIDVSFLTNISAIKSNLKAHDLKAMSIEQHTNIPEGKGYSSGPTDIVSVLLALKDLYNFPLSKAMIYKIAAKVLPTDPVLDYAIDQIFNPLTGERVFNLIPQELGVIYFDADPAKSLNTKEIFKNLAYTSQEYVDFNTMLQLYHNGCILRDFELLFEAITMSAKINQRINPKPLFIELLGFAAQNKMGVFVAHTGTVMGLVMQANRVEVNFIQAQAFIFKHWLQKAYTDQSKSSHLSIA